MSCSGCASWLRPSAIARRAECALALVVLASTGALAQGQGARTAVSITLSKDRPASSRFAPLEDVVVEFSPREVRGRLVVRDGRGQPYVDVARASSGVRFQVTGALGTHHIELHLGRGTLVRFPFTVDAHTTLSTGGGRWDGFLGRLSGQVQEGRRFAFIDGESVSYILNTLRGSQQVARALRYFSPDFASPLALFLRYQRPSGALYSSFALDDHFDPYTGTYPGVHFERDIYGPDYTGRSQDGRFVFARPPVEADTEALAAEYLLLVWQAGGDAPATAAALPRIERGLEYLLSDPLRFSPERGLIKRGFTIDVWNLQNPRILKLHPRGNKNLGGWTDLQWIDADTPMGVAHGDNSAFYAAALALARLWAHAGESDRAARWTRQAETVRESLLSSSWNGSYFRHFVPLVPLPEVYDWGAVEERRLSFSNPIAIRRGLTTHAQAVAMLAEYQRRRARLPEGVLAEWTILDPPYREGFGYMAPGDYANGGISPAVAGELALAAFEHGLEGYGADILDRLLALNDRSGRLAGLYYRSSRQADWQPEVFHTVDLRAVVNRNLRGDREHSFIGHPENDLREFPVGHQKFLGKPFDIIDPRQNGERAALVLWAEGSLGPRETVVSGIGRRAASIYFLHSAGNSVSGHARIGEYEITYEDGTRARLPLFMGRNIGAWWSGEETSEWRIAWRGRNPHVSVLVVGIWGWNNPQPDKPIASITARALNGGRIQLLGITLSSVPVQYERGAAQRTFPESWAVAPVVAALIEGLGGVRDQHQMFEHVTISPRWQFVGETRAELSVRYPVSDGYLAYRWEHFPSDRRIVLSCAGSGARFDFHVPLPPGASAQRVTAGGRMLRFSPVVVEETPYVDFSVERGALGAIEVRYRI